MFASAIGGVHSWEISLVKFNRYLLVSLITQEASCRNPSTNATFTKTFRYLGRIYRILDLCSKRKFRKDSSTCFLLETVTAAVVPLLDICNAWSRHRVHHRNILQSDLRVRSYRKEFRRHHHCRFMHQLGSALHCNCGCEYHLGCDPLHSAYPNACCATGSTQAENRPYVYLWRWLHVSWSTTA